jgi:hypothetical protein
MVMVCTRGVSVSHHCSWCGPSEFLWDGASDAFTPQKYSLCLYNIIKTVCHSLTSEMKSHILATANLTPVRILFAMLKTMLEGLPGGVVAERHTQQRAGEVQDLMSSKVLPGENLQLGKEGKRDTQQEEATT